MARNRPSPTPRRCSASSSASTLGLGTPAPARIWAAARTASPRVAPPSRDWTRSTDSACRSGLRSDVIWFAVRLVADGVQAGLLVHLNGGLDDRLEVAVHDLVKVVRLVARAVVRNAVFRVVVRADPLRAVHGADLRLALLGVGGVDLFLLVREDAGTENAHAGFAVLQLRLFVLHGHHDARGKVRDADGGV